MMGTAGGSLAVNSGASLPADDTHTHTHTNLMDLFQDYLGKPVPER